MLQYWTYSNLPIKPPLILNTNELEVSYETAKGVLVENELSIVPRGLVINVCYSLDN